MGFTGIDTSQCTGDTVALTHASGIGLNNVVKFAERGGVELIGNMPPAVKPTGAAPVCLSVVSPRSCCCVRHR